MKTEPVATKEYTITADWPSARELHLTISGELSFNTYIHVKKELSALLAQRSPLRITVDVGKVRYLDSAGALLLITLGHQASGDSLPTSIINQTAAVAGILASVDRAAIEQAGAAPVDESNVIEQIGAESLLVVSDFKNLTTFLGDLLISLYHTIRHPASVRWQDVLFYVKRSGLDGLPIVALLSFLLGLIIAFMSSLQLKQFGANIYVAALVGFGMVRELGPIMAAIIFAGRSGSAFAAEIGTMMVNEEVDALVTMGFNPTRFLALPKVLAALFVMPLLTLYADFFGILGGMLVGVLGFDLTAYSYLQQTIRSISIFDILSSLCKSLVFAVLIAGIGCQRGFCVRGGAEAVGKYTTSAVVAGLFLIIVADSIFAIILYYIN